MLFGRKDNEATSRMPSKDASKDLDMTHQPTHLKIDPKDKWDRVLPDIDASRVANKRLDHLKAKLNPLVAVIAKDHPEIIEEPTALEHKRIVLHKFKYGSRRNVWQYFMTFKDKDIHESI